MKEKLSVVALLLAFGLPGTAYAAQDEIPVAIAGKQHASEDIPVVPAATLELAKEKTKAQTAGLRPDRRNATAAQTSSKPNLNQPVNEKINLTQKQARATSVINRESKVLVQPGENAVISIARNQPNRLVTPFKEPVLVTSDLTGGKGNECGEACARGSVIYVTTDQQKPVTVFISEAGREDVAISLTMVPERIAPRQIELILPDEVIETLRVGQSSTVLSGNSDEAMRWERSQPYVDMIRSSFREVALGEVPQGFSLRRTKKNDKVPFCRQSGLEFNFKQGQVLEGHDMTIYVGTVENTYTEAIEINEMRCGNWNVAAVASYPLKVLRPAQKTEIYVAVKREVKRSPSSVRKPLIERQFH